jgi:hypothetical protein
MSNITKEEYKARCLAKNKTPEQAKLDRNGDDGLISDVCQLCGGRISEEDFAVGFGYWKPIFLPYHQKCVSDGYKERALLCQQIDADCNDCKHFLRKDGLCLKLNKPTGALSNFCSGYTCFQHRKENP